MTVVCPSWSASSDGARFCPSCGRALDLVTASPEPAGDAARKARDGEAETRLTSVTGIGADVGPASPTGRQAGASKEARTSGRASDLGGAPPLRGAAGHRELVIGPVIANAVRGVLWIVVALLHFGLLTLVTAFFTGMMYAIMPFRLGWFAPSSVLVIALVGGIAAFGAWASADLRALVPRLLGEDRNR